MAFKPAALDHVNIYVRNAERSHRWYTEIFGFHTQDMAYVPETGKLRAAFLACSADHAHDIALLLAREASEKGCDLLDVLMANPEVHGALSEQELRALLDPTNYLGRAEEVVEEVVARAAGRPSQPASSGDAGRRAVEATR